MNTEPDPVATRTAHRWPTGRGLTHRRLVPAAVTLAVALLLLGGVGLPGLLARLASRPATPGAAAGPPSLPAPFAGLSLLTGSVSASPPGQVAALYGAGLSVDWPYGQAMSLSAHGDRYRRLTVAEDRTSLGGPAGPAPTALAPDGRKVAVGDSWCGGASTVALVDLTTGRVRTIATGRNGSLAPLAWSSDGRYLAFRTAYQHPSGVLGVLDVRTGRTVDLSRYNRVSAAAFDPRDDERLAVQNGPTLLVVSFRDGHPIGTPAVPAYRVLDGPNAWSPDGTSIATAPGNIDDYPQLSPAAFDRVLARSFVFVPWSGSGADRTVTDDPNTPATTGRILGWRSADDFVTRGSSGADTRYDDEALVMTSLATGGRRELATIDHGNHEVADLQLATSLVPTLTFRTPGPPDRGPRPGWYQALPLAPILAASAILILVLLRTWRRRPGPEVRRNLNRSS